MARMGAAIKAARRKRMVKSRDRKQGKLHYREPRLYKLSRIRRKIDKDYDRLWKIGGYGD